LQIASAEAGADAIADIECRSGCRAIADIECRGDCRGGCPILAALFAARVGTIIHA